MQAMRLHPLSGKEAMLGKTEIVLKNINPDGKIGYDSEIWNAKSYSKAFAVGDSVIIRGFYGMSVLVDEVPVERVARW